MALFGKPKAGGFMDEIRCDEPSYLIWKWHPAESQQGNNSRENAIRWGSSLRVKDGEVAVFVYKQKDGTMQDFIVGPYDQTIKTANFPVLASIVGLAYEGGTPFQAEVYFINLARVIQVKFGVPFFDVYDPRFLDFGGIIYEPGSKSDSDSRSRNSNADNCEYGILCGFGRKTIGPLLFDRVVSSYCSQKSSQRNLHLEAGHEELGFG